MKRFLTFWIILMALVIVSVVQAQENLILNGSFDTPDIMNPPDLFKTFNISPTNFVWFIVSDGTPETGSTTGFLGVDLMNAIWEGIGGTNNSDGFDQSVDIDGASSISQSFATVIGHTYTVEFFYSRNSVFGNLSSSGVVTVAGNTTRLEEFLVHDVPKDSPSDMQWLLFSQTFIADSTATTLTIQGDAANAGFGFVVDNVHVTSSSGGNQPGDSQDNPILPDQTGSNSACRALCPGPPFRGTITCYCFNGIFGRGGSGGGGFSVWIDPPLASGYIYEMTSDSLFLGVADFPTGFDSPFTVSVNDTSLGQFGPGDSVSFGNGVTRFSVSGINPLVNAEDPVAFPLQVAFNTEIASLAMRAFLQINIDIKPGSDDNSINLKSNGVIPVAIPTTNGFDASTVDPSSVRFGPNSAMETHGTGHIEDVDGDGDDDMVFHFRTQETGIQCGDTEARLTGETGDGLRLDGSDAIAVKCK